MAKIIKDEKQVKACEEIEENLAQIRQINLSLLSEGSHFISYKASDNAKEVKILLPEEERKKAIALLNGFKSRLAKDVISKSTKYRIELTSEEAELVKG